MNEQNDKGYTCLHRAASKGNVDVIRCLLDQGKPFKKQLSCKLPCQKPTFQLKIDTLFLQVLTLISRIIQESIHWTVRRTLVCRTFTLIALKTRKSSCVNARTYRPKRSKPSLCCSIPEGWGYPILIWSGGTPVLSRGYLGYSLARTRVTPPPPKDLGPVIWERTWYWGTPWWWTD